MTQAQIETPKCNCENSIGQTAMWVCNLCGKPHSDYNYSTEMYKRMEAFIHFIFENNCQWEPGNEKVYYKAESMDEELLTAFQLIQRFETISYFKKHNPPPMTSHLAEELTEIENYLQNELKK